jgi:acyl-coenzyme A thioesterase PaaI-like protein
MEQSLQDKYAAKSICFGCGPSNSKGLQIKSFVKGNEVVATWTPQEFHHAFPNVVNGGIIGSLLDCHSNWTAAWWLMKSNNETQPPCTVTSEFHVKLLRPHS